MARRYFTILGSLIGLITTLATIHDIPKLHAYPIVPLYITDAFELAFLGLTKFSFAVFIVTWICMFAWFRNTIDFMKSRRTFIIFPIDAILLIAVTMVISHFLAFPEYRLSVLPMTTFDVANMAWNIIAVACFCYLSYYLTQVSLTTVNKYIDTTNSIRLLFGVPFAWRFLSIVLPIPDLLFTVSGLLCAAFVAYLGSTIDQKALHAVKLA